MKQFFVVKFIVNRAYLYISKAETIEDALSLYLGISKCIGSFCFDNMYGKEGFAIEIENPEFQMSDLLAPLSYLFSSQKITQNIY